MIAGFLVMIYLISVTLILFSFAGSVRAQQDSGRVKSSFGGTFESLRPEQKQLLQKWVVEYNRITGKRLTAVKVYNGLPGSYRTTFDAVTHALLTTSLTAANGVKIGKALDLIELVETIHGQIHGAPGDRQFRVYALLKKDALDKLYASREFKRIGDNTVFHKGYPINFRQQGGSPSIQFSIARTGRRADIDVDYRSSAAYAALFNGHLTSANSDVRAGNNYNRHIGRWQGFENWWQNLFNLLFLEDREKVQAPEVPLEISDTPRVDASKGVHEAVKDFYQAWLIEQNPLISAAYFSIKSYPCIVDFQDGSQPDSPLARARMVKHMRDVNDQLGRISKLEEVVQAAPIYAPGARPVINPYGKIFSLEHLPDEVAYQMDCRIRLKMKLVEEIPKPGKGFSDYYGSIVRLKTGKESAIHLFQVWSKEGKDWKIVAWHIENPFKAPDVPIIAGNSERSGDKTAAVIPDDEISRQMRAQVRARYQGANGVAVDEEVSRQTREFMTEWLLNHQIDLALSRLTPDALGCAAEELGIVASNERENRKRTQELFARIAEEAGQGKSLGDLLVALDVLHEHINSVDHPESKSYVLARISDDLSVMYHCGRRLSESKFGKDHAQGAPNFSRNHYITLFQLKRGGNHPAAFQLIWEKQGNEWKVIAFAIIAH